MAASFQWDEAFAKTWAGKWAYDSAGADLMIRFVDALYDAEVLASR